MYILTGKHPLHTVYQVIFQDQKIMDTHTMSVLCSIASIFHQGRRGKIQDTLCGWKSFLTLVKITLQ